MNYLAGAFFDRYLWPQRINSIWLATYALLFEKKHPLNKLTKTPVLFIGLLFGLWLLSLLMVAPWANIPINDDWVYAYPVRSLWEVQGFQLPQRTDPNILTQAFLGWGVTELAGSFSFVTLRIMVWAIGFLGITGVFYLLKNWKLPSSVALLGGLFCLTQPIYLSLSFTFMSEIPFLAAGIGMFLSWQAFLKRPGAGRLMLALFLGLLALGNRQFGLLFFLGMGGAMFIHFLSDPRQRWRLYAALAMLGVGISGHVLLETWVKPHLLDAPLYFGSGAFILQRVFNEPVLLLLSFAKRAMATVVMLGLWLSPLLPVLLKSNRIRLSQSLVLALLPLGILACAAIPAEVFSPLRGNIFYNFGLGPLTIYEEGTRRVAHAFQLGRFFEWAIAFLGLANMALVARHLFSRKEQSLWRDEFGHSLALTALLFLPASYLAGAFFDRYLLFPLLALAVLIVKALPAGFAAGWRWQGSVFALFFLFATLGTRDYFSWQKARWQTFELAKEKGIPPIAVNGGFEINGWAHGYSLMEENSARLDSLRSLHQYRLGFDAMPGESRVDSVEFFRCLPPGKDYLLLLRDEKK